MRYFVPVIYAFFSFLCLLSCQKSVDFKTIVELHSDDVISSMDTKELHSYELQLKKAADFFEENDSYRDAMASFVKLGKVQIKEKKFLESSISLRTALSYAEKINDAHSSAIIYMLLSSVYNVTIEKTESIKCLIKAEQLFAKTSDEISRYKVMMDLGVTYMELQKYDKSENYFNRVLTWAKEKNDSVLLGKCMTEYAKAKIKKPSPDPHQAIAFMEDAVSLYDTKLTVDDKSTLAYAYYLVGDSDKAQRTISQAGEMVDDTKSRLIYSYWRYMMNQYDSDSDDVRRWQGVSDSLQMMLMDDVLNKSIQSAEIAYYMAANKENKEKLAESRLLTDVILSLSVTMITLCIIVFFVLRKLDKKRTENYEDSLKSLAQDNEQLNISRAEYYQSMNTGEVSSFLNNMIETYYERKGTTKVKDAVLLNLESFIDKVHKDRNLQFEMENTINLLLGNVVLQLRNECPQLNESEYFLFTLLAMGFSFISIGVLMGQEPEQIYRLKYRLKQKIKKSSASQKDRFLDIIA